MPELFHRQLNCGIEFAAAVLPERPIVALELHILAGTAHEPPNHLGVARLIDETIEKGTAKRDGRALLDAFDAIGAARSSRADRETTGFRCRCLPEFLPRAIELYSEMLTMPSFPQDACEVAVELALQELAALEDDPQSLADKLIAEQAYGDPLGRHPLGNAETLKATTRDNIAEQWRSTFAAGRMLACVAGNIEPNRAADALDKAFEGFGNNDHAGREVCPIPFAPMRTHHAKELEQQQIAICYPGVAVSADDFPVERVMIGVLAGGMSARLFTEVREKQGLVYWVGAWAEHPRQAGMIHLGASTTPERCDKTFTTLLREVDRLAEDLEPAEVDRAITGIEARTQTRGDITSAHAAELVSDLFHYGHPVPIEEKIAKIKRVSVEDVRAYLLAHPREQLSVLTLGPRALAS